MTPFCAYTLKTSSTFAFDNVKYILFDPLSRGLKSFYLLFTFYFIKYGTNSEEYLFCCH